MYAAPPLIDTRVFARLPDHLRMRGRQSRWLDIQFHGKDTGCFLEGPSFDRAGNLYVVDIPWGRIFRISPQGEFSLVAEYEGEPNGLKIHRDGPANWRRSMRSEICSRPSLHVWKRSQPSVRPSSIWSGRWEEAGRPMQSVTRLQEY